MLLGPLDFPEPLLDAAAEGRLVVFAGAGVGMGSPARMPSFWELCQEIGEGLSADLQPHDREPEDQYLGRLADARVPVHERAAHALRRRGTEPNPLHEHLLSLFPSADRCRLATTNFDTLFENAARKIWGEQVPAVFSASALPFGGRFFGLAYLHGRLDSPQSCLVLSDADFSQAYLTEGWARRFLREMVAELTVLFVGFSFNDVPSRYLLRGLPVTESLYALVPRDEAARVPRGLNLITFDKRDDYQSLRVGVRELARFARRDEAGHYSALQRLISAPPPPAGPEADNLDWALRHPTFAPLVCQTDNFQRRPWLDWVLARGLLRDAFDSERSLPDPLLVLTRWFWWMAFRDDSWRACAEAVAKRRGELAPDARQALLRALASQNRELAARNESPGPREEFWLALASGCPGPTLREVSYEQLLFWKTPATAEFLLQLFTDSTEPVLRIASRTPFPGHEDKPAVQFEVDLAVDAYTLRTFWDERCRPRLPDLAPRLVTLLHARLELAHRLLRMSGEARDRWDPASFARTAIADSPQNDSSDRRAFSTLIVAARDSMAWLAEHQPEVGRGLFEIWNESPAVLVRRVAFCALIHLRAFPPDQVLTRVLDEKWLDIPSAKPEVFAVLRGFYPAACDGSRSRFIERIMAAPVDAEEDLEPERRAELARIREYKQFNLLHWLHDADPDCPYASNALAESRARNPTFTVREHPDLDHWTSEGGWVEAVSPAADQEIEAMSATELIEQLRKIRSGRLRGNPRVDEHQGVLDQVGSLAAANLDWAFQTAGDLISDDEECGRLLAAILRGWRTASLDAPAASKVLAWLEDRPWLERVVGEVSPVIDAILERSARQLAESDLQCSERLIARLWAAAPAYTPGAIWSDDWLMRAINQAQGQLALAAVHLASEWRRRQGGTWTAMPTPLQVLMKRMISGDPRTHPLGRVVIASQLHFLFAADEAFTVAEVLPWFDWSKHLEDAPQAWQGYLGWGRIYPALFKELQPSLEQIFEHLDTLGSTREELSKFLAQYALDPEVEPIADGWLTRFFAAAGPEDRERWTSTVSHEIERCEVAEAARVWSAWLSEWLQERLERGYPAVSAGELKAFYGIVLALPAADLPAAVNLMTAHPAPAGADYALRRLEERIADLSPNDFARLLLLLLQNRASDLFLRHADAVKDKLAQAPRREDVSALRAHLLRLNQPDLADQITPNTDPPAPS